MLSQVEPKQMFRLIDAVHEYASAVRWHAWAFSDHGPTSERCERAGRREREAFRVVCGLAYQSIDYVVPIASLAPEAES